MLYLGIFGLEFEKATAIKAVEFVLLLSLVQS